MKNKKNYTVEVEDNLRKLITYLVDNYDNDSLIIYKMKPKEEFILQILDIIKTNVNEISIIDPSSSEYNWLIKYGGVATRKVDNSDNSDILLNNKFFNNETENNYNREILLHEILHCSEVQNKIYNDTYNFLPSLVRSNIYFEGDASYTTSALWSNAMAPELPIAEYTEKESNDSSVQKISIRKKLTRQYDTDYGRYAYYNEMILFLVDGKENYDKIIEEEGLIGIKNYLDNKYNGPIYKQIISKIYALCIKQTNTIEGSNDTYEYIDRDYHMLLLDNCYVNVLSYITDLYFKIKDLKNKNDKTIYEEELLLNMEQEIEKTIHNSEKLKSDMKYQIETNEYAYKYANEMNEYELYTGILNDIINLKLFSPYLNLKNEEQKEQLITDLEYFKNNILPKYICTKIEYDYTNKNFPKMRGYTSLDITQQIFPILKDIEAGLLNKTSKDIEIAIVSKEVEHVR